MPELRAQIELTKTNPNGWVEYATGKGTSWYFKESKAREWLENDYAKWRLFYLERYKGRPQYFLEQVRRFGAQWASERYKVLDPKTLRELSFKEKLIFAGAIL